ncbi:Probable lipoprotein precursor [Tenacibaculum maritimum]|uniref:hypothetical protein n=1 Tax=Tenacibaculum maritimum TaxID=107401 RepID=UPI0012E56073|nr:hypothetical protein [Tenacibaculum maritimum]CAA0183515.1 Probable lipoprotein precursor [Tenacibaculum maritimum]
MKKYIILTTLTLLISCKTKTPIVKLTTSDKYPVILLPSKKNKGVWDISFPFNIAITNPSYKTKRLSYYKYYCNYYYLKKEKKICGKGLMYKLDKGNLLKKSIWEDKDIPWKTTKKYVFYSRHYLDTLKYPRSFFKEYYQKLKESGLKDSLPVGTLAEFKKKHPKILEDLLKKDSIYFRFPFPKRDKVKGYSEGVKVPVVY